MFQLFSNENINEQNLSSICVKIDLFSEFCFFVQKLLIFQIAIVVTVN